MREVSTMKARGALLALFVTACVANAAGDSPRLIAAVQQQDLADLRASIAENADVDAVDAQSATALHWAAHYNNTDAVRLLLEAGADPNARNRFDVTPLHEAALQNNPALVAALLEAGADPNAAFGDGETALMTASRAGDGEVVRLMIEHGGDVSVTESYHGQTALMWAAQENHADVVRALIAAGADVNHVSNIYEWQDMSYAAGTVQMARDIGGLTPLHLAARHGSLESAVALAEGGADLAATEPMYEFTPLQTSVVNGHYRTAVALLELGADANDGSLYVAVDTRHLGFFTQRANPPDKDGDVSNLDIITRLLEAGADPDMPYAKGIPMRTVGTRIPVPDGATALDRAAFAYDADVIRVLLDHGANPDVAADDGATPLMLLSGLSRGRAYMSLQRPKVDPESGPVLDAVTALLEAGADPNITHPESGDTALHYAARAKADQLVELLLAHGANPDAVNSDGITAIVVAGTD